MTVRREIIYPDGRVIARQSPLTMQDIEDVICQGLPAEEPRCLSTINLRDAEGHVMLIHDMGHDLELPDNAKATELYHAVCIPGTTWRIVGTVVVVPDSDFAR